MKRLALLVTLLTSSILALADETGIVAGTLEIDGVQRTWELFVPSSYDPKTPVPLVLDFHGTGGTPDGQSKTSGFRELARKHNILVVNPAGKHRRTPGGGQTWNVDLDPGVDDVQFVREMIAHLRERYSIDARRIYSTGFSGGARMSSRLACDLSDVIAAIGAVGGIRFPEKCTPSQPVAILAIHSVDDEVNHYVHRADSPGYWPQGVEAAVAHWARHKSCESTPTQATISPGVTRLDYQRCRAGDLVLIRLDTGGHTWPGSARAREVQGATSFKATEAVWEFFEQSHRSSGQRSDR